MLLIALVFLFLFILYKPVYDAHKTIKQAQTEYNETVDDRIEYMQNILQRRRYVPLEVLPTVRFNTELGTINDGENKCFSVPVYVGSDNMPGFDCTALCDDPSALYFFVGEYDRFVVNGQLLTRGGYCTTNSLPRNCNRETSVVLHSLNQWSCIAEDPRYFAGTQNMVQVAGRQHADKIAPGQITRNVLFDRLLGMEVDVSRNTFRRDWDEMMPDNSGRRFEMRCNALDERNNRMFVNPLNPIECLPNFCTNVVNVHPDVKPDFVNNRCDCGDFNVTRVRNIDLNDPSSICSGVFNRFDNDSLSFQIRVECNNLDMLLSNYNENAPLCPPSIFTQNTDNAYLFTLPGSFPMSLNGLDEPTHRFYMDTKSRVTYIRDRSLPSSVHSN